MRDPTSAIHVINPPWPHLPSENDDLRMQALILENDQDHRSHLLAGLAAHGIHGYAVSSARRALAALDDADAVIIALDLERPSSAIEVCQAVRASTQAPLIVIADKREVLVPDAGPDYLTQRPADINGVVAVITAINRRNTTQRPERVAVEVGDVFINLLTRTVTVAGRPVSISNKEFQVLAALIACNGAVRTKAQLCRELWGDPSSVMYDALRVHISTLRSKLARPNIIETVHGIGYRLAQVGGD